MVKLEELKNITQQGTRFIEKQKGVKEVEVFASANTLNILRIAFSSNVPSNGVEEAKTLHDFGLSVRVLFSDGKIGFGKQNSSITMDAVKNAFAKAQKNAVKDNDFKSLPEPSKKKIQKCEFDKKIQELDEVKAVDKAYDALSGAINFLEKKNFDKNTNITGEIDFLSEKISVTNSNGVNATDQNTAAYTTLTTIFELDKDVSGMWYDTSIFMKNLDSYKTGEISAEKAYSMRNSESVKSGAYPVIFGSTVVSELLHSRFEVSMGSIEVNASPYTVDLLGKQIADEKLTITDNGILEGAIGSKSVTDEGHPTQKTVLLDKGKLVNFLSNDYYKKKHAELESLQPTNGFRFGGGGRHYTSEPGISATNIEVMAGKMSDEELIKEVKNGLYIGRIWYTYPVNGLASSDFTSTVRGDSFLIENGEIKNAVTPNTLRLNENLNELLIGITGIGKQRKHCVSWGEESVIVAPQISVKKARFQQIAVGLYS